ncbi:hypothetical protein [Desulforegula conservatrix]|uniref:hypothetical protein n=1 Tax=Desulforegula conservatrix TaxID=153026 RepID=UPI000411DDC9|nr:hypothetical protein [Desulforegula conservatrix]
MADYTPKHFGDRKAILNLKEFRETNQPRTLPYALNKHRISRLSAEKSGGPEGYLSSIASEFKLREYIYKENIFFIGDLLCEARDVIKTSKEITFSFKEWVEKTCDFSYETALNFCRVYSLCSERTINVLLIKRTILFEICSDKFPEDFRDYLLSSEKTLGMSIKGFKKLYKTFEEKGWAGFEAELENYEAANRLIEHIQNYKHKIEKAISILRNERTEFLNGIIIQKIANKIPLNDHEQRLYNVYQAFETSIRQLHQLSDGYFDDEHKNILDQFIDNFEA